MTGIFLLVVVALWSYCAFRIARWASQRIAKPTLRRGTILLLFVMLMILPVGDEIIGGMQFRALCEANEFIDVDIEKIRGKTIVLGGETNMGLPGMIDRSIASVIPIIESTSTWKDETTGETLLTYKQYLASGGWLVRFFKLTESSVPIAFSKHSCQPRNKPQVFAVVKTK
ncbi:hypothetical protein [Parvibium lacunae]|uniref:Uncharacterized protein n=1 Tax=Parvibium lacunae TaxID=1888893 RepID=A0A368KZH7_9BURK|nr:hypothetical protein [Parvibium lacunae]RCS56715.1 hypothetical protein DU000_10205 [Parvibium lacunae]